MYFLLFFANHSLFFFLIFFYVNCFLLQPFFSLGGFRKQQKKNKIRKLYLKKIENKIENILEFTLKKVVDTV
jgi:hypothetical protein